MDSQKRQKLDWGRALGAVGLCLGSVIFSLLIAEAASRLFLSPPYLLSQWDRAFPILHRPDPKIGWVLSSNSMKFPYRFIDEHGSVADNVVYTVENGRRVTSAHPSAGAFIVTTGCSFTFGHRINDQDTWPWLLQERLPNYQVANVAVSGYGTDQALLAAERQVLSSPRQTAAVVLGLADFHIERNRSSQAWLATMYPFSKPFFAIRSGDAEYRYMVGYWSLGFITDHSWFLSRITSVIGNIYYGIPSHNQARDLTVALITTFAKRFTADGVRLVVVLLPWRGDQLPQPRTDRAYLTEHLRAAQIPVLIPDFPRLADGRFDYFRFTVNIRDSHPNRQYNLVLSDQLKQFLQSTGAIPRQRSVSAGTRTQAANLSRAEVAR